MPRLFQDAAGTIPAVLPGQSVGLIQRAAGTVDVSQATASLKPTLARFPRGGRRNRMSRNDWSFLPVGVSLTTAIVSDSFSLRANSLPGTGITAICTGYGVDSGVPWVDLALSGTNSSGGVVDLITRQEANIAVVPNQQFTVSGTAQVIAGSATGLQFSVDAQVRNGSTFVRSMVSGYNNASTSPLSMLATTTIAGSGENNVNYNSITTRFLSGATVDATVRMSGIQAEDGGVATQVQRVISQYDVTEAGKDEIWHLYYDGADDAMGITLPAGTYGRARVDPLGNVTVDSVTDPTGVTFGAATRVADFMLRQGAFSAAEIAALTNYWEGLYK